MTFLALTPVILSLLLLAAHLHRAGLGIPAVFSLALGLLLLVRRSWVPWIMQAVLVLASLEWVRQMVYLIRIRQDHGEPWGRLAVILGAVALFTALSALVFFIPRVRRRYS